jgi:hypothetical protein
MKTFRVARPCNPVKLHEDLIAAGVPVVTVRASIVHGDPFDLAQFAVVLTEDNVPDNIAGLINSHIENRIPKAWTPPGGKTLEGILQEYEKLGD